MVTFQAQTCVKRLRATDETFAVRAPITEGFLDLRENCSEQAVTSTLLQTSSTPPGLGVVRVEIRTSVTSAMLDANQDAAGEAVRVDALDVVEAGCNPVLLPAIRTGERLKGSQTLSPLGLLINFSGC